MANEDITIQISSTPPDGLAHKSRKEEIEELPQYLKAVRTYPDGTVTGVIMEDTESVKDANTDKPQFVLNETGVLTDIKTYDNDGVWSNAQLSADNLPDGVITGLKVAEAVAGNGLTKDGDGNLALDASLSDLTVSPWAIIDFDTVTIPTQGNPVVVPIDTAATIKYGGGVTVSATGFTVPITGRYWVSMFGACVDISAANIVQMKLTGEASAVTGTVQQAAASALSLFIPAGGMVILNASTTYQFTIGRTSGVETSPVPQLNGADISSGACIEYRGVSS